MLKQIVAICQKHRSANESYTADYLESDIEQAVYTVSDYDQLLRYLYCIIELVFHIQKQKNREERPSKLLVEEITEFIEANYTEPINHQTLAERFGLVPSYISKLFNQRKGCSPGKYLINLRIDKAKELMRTSPELKVWNIAEIVGYSDPQYFSRIFKKETGKYPSEYIESLQLQI